MTRTLLDPRVAGLDALPTDVQLLTVEDIIDREITAGQPFGPFHRRWLLERAPEKVRRNLDLAAKRPDLVGMPASQFTGPEGAVSANPSSFTSVTASATDTNLWVPSIWTPIPANSARAGGVYNIKFGGVFTSTATQGVLTWTPRYGQSATVATNPTLGASNATAPAASLTGAAWYGEFTATIRALGLAAAGGTITGNGFVVTQGAAAATGTMYVLGGTVPTAFDNTAASGLVVSLTISVASQSYTCQWVTPVRSLL
jgi:hypothetical protein